MIYILVGLAVILAVAATLIARYPNSFVVKRKAVIPARPDEVFAYINTLSLWEEWSPWAKLDPSARTAFEGPAQGVGAVMSWDGNRSVGAGRMEIIESVPGRLIRLRLDFLRPMKAVNEAIFTFSERGNATEVTWEMKGINGFFGKLVNFVMDCESMVGRQFEQGLSNLRTAVERDRQVI